MLALLLVNACCHVHGWMIDGSFGLEMETFEFLNLLQVGLLCYMYHVIYLLFIYVNVIAC
jgi:hypothetical protein